jgi:hypothetical protein
MDLISERSDKSSLCTAIPQLNQAKRSLVPGRTGLFALSAATQTGQICYKAAKDADSKKTLQLKNFRPQPMLHVPVDEVERATFPVNYAFFAKDPQQRTKDRSSYADLRPGSIALLTTSMTGTRYDRQRKYWTPARTSGQGIETRK